MSIEMQRILVVWKRKDLVHAVQITDRLVENGLTIEDLRKFLEENTQPSNMREGFVQKPTHKCPNCGGVVKLFSIDETHSKWECCKTCSQDPCGWIEVIDKSIEEVIAMEVNQNGLR